MMMAWPVDAVQDPAARSGGPGPKGPGEPDLCVGVSDGRLRATDWYLSVP